MFIIKHFNIHTESHLHNLCKLCALSNQTKLFWAKPSMRAGVNDA